MNSFHRDSVSEFCWSWTGGAVSLILAQQRCCFFNTWHNIGVCIEVVTLFHEYLCICIVPNTSHVYSIYIIFLYTSMHTVSWLWHIVMPPIWASRNSTIQGLLLLLLQPPLGQSLDLWLLSTAEWWFWLEIYTQYLLYLPYISTCYIYFNQNHKKVTSSEGWSLSNKGHWIAKDRFEWRKLFRVHFVDGGSKCTLLGEAMSVDAFLGTPRTGTRWTRLVEFISNMKIVLALPGCLGALTLHDVTETTPAVTRSLRRALCPKRHVWAVLVDESLLFALMPHFPSIQPDLFLQRDAKDVCDMWDSFLAEGRLSCSKLLKSKLCVFKTLSLFRPRKTQALSTSLQT